MMRRHLLLLVVLLAIPFFSCLREPSEVQPGETDTSLALPRETAIDTEQSSNQSHPSEGKGPTLVAPFTQEEAVTAQKECSQSLGTPVEISNSIGMKLKLIPPGEFMMGSPVSEQDRHDSEHQHRVRITKPFYLGVYEVTQKEYERVTNTNPSWFSSVGNGKEKVADRDTSRFPVE